MTDQKDDGGPAFPRTANEQDRTADLYSEIGMSLRDYFAAAALTGMLTDGTLSDNDELVVDAFKVADAMLAARKAKT